MVGMFGLVFAQTAWGQKSSAPVSVKVETVRGDTFLEYAEALGTLKARDAVDITANVTEIIEKIHFRDGQFVKKGELLVEMTSAEEQALLDEAQSNVLEAERQLNRIAKLVAGGKASESLLDERKRDFRSAQAQIAASQSRLKDRILKAPFGGTLGLSNVSEGALVRPGDIITTLTDNSEMKLDFALPTVFFAQIKENLPITAHTRAYGEREFVGVVSSIDNQVDPVTRSIQVRAIIPNDERALRPGMLMMVKLIVAQRQALIISESALLPEGSDNFVMVASPKDNVWVAQKRQVTIGGRRVGEVEIIAGLSEGERVITHGGFKIAPGSLVEFAASDKRIDLSTSTSTSSPLSLAK